jgi:hypothetical protein
MTIVAAGSVNTTANIVPDLLVQIVSPQVALLNGVPSNVLGIVGTASWGPINSPVVVGSMAQYSANFGPILARKYDAGTQAATATLQGANAFRVVRVTDGSDTAASATVGTSPTSMTFTSKYTGSYGNNTKVVIATGSAASTWRATVSIPSQVPEVFDNISGSGNAFWINLASAINNGQSGVRGPSQIVIGTAGSGSATPTASSYSLSGGTDGVSSVVGNTLVGANTSPPTGMYAMANSGVSIALLADCDDSTTWTTQDAFGLANGIYMLCVGPAGQTVATAASAKSGAGLDSYGTKLLMGDWCYWQDNVNNQQRLVSPQGFVGGLLANLSPQNSGLNKQILGIIGTQSSSQGYRYTNADLQVLGQASIDVVCNNLPGGNYFGPRFGRNSSSNAVIHGDNYTRLTNYIASTLNAGLGMFIGKNQTATTQQQALATLNAFFQNLWDQGLIGNSDGTTIPYSVRCDSSNNSASRVALGYMQADCKVQFASVIETLIANIEGGQSVQISRTSTAPNA